MDSFLKYDILKYIWVTGYSPGLFFGRTVKGGIAVSNQIHRTCIRMSAAEYQQLMKKSKSARLSANVWLMEQLAQNRPILNRREDLQNLIRLMNQRGKEINAVARDFNSGYGTAESLRQAFQCLAEIYKAQYALRKMGFPHAP